MVPVLRDIVLHKEAFTAVAIAEPFAKPRVRNAMNRAHSAILRELE